MAALQAKLRIYQTLSSLNQGFEQAVHDLQELEQLEVLATDFSQLFQDRTEELRTEINRRLAEELAATEARDSKSYERKVLNWKGEREAT